MTRRTKARLALLAMPALLAGLMAAAQPSAAQEACPPPGAHEGSSAALRAQIWLDHARCLHNLAAPAAGLREAAELERVHVQEHDRAVARLAGTESALARRIPLGAAVLAPGADRGEALARILRGRSGLAYSDRSRHLGGGASLAVPPERLRVSQGDLDQIGLSRIAGEANARRALERTRSDSAAGMALPGPEAWEGDGPPPPGAERGMAEARDRAGETLAGEGIPAEDPGTAAAILEMGRRAELAVAEERAMRASGEAPGRVRPADMASDPESAGRLRQALLGPLSGTARPGAMDSLDPGAEARRAGRRTLAAMEGEPSAFGLRAGWRDARSGGSCTPGAWPGERLACFMRGGELEARRRCETDRGGRQVRCRCERRCASAHGGPTPSAWLRDWKAERFHACMAETPDGSVQPWLRPRCGPAMMRLRARAVSGDEIQWREVRGGARDFVAGIEADLAAGAAERAGLPGALDMAEGLLDEAEREIAARRGAEVARESLRRRRCALAAVKACAGAAEPPRLGPAPWEGPSPAACVPACP